MTLQTRVGLLVFSAVLVVICAVVIGNYFVTDRQLRMEIDASLNDRSQQIAAIPEIGTLLTQRAYNTEKQPSNTFTTGDSEWIYEESRTTDFDKSETWETFGSEQSASAEWDLDKWNTTTKETPADWKDFGPLNGVIDGARNETNISASVNWPRDPFYDALDEKEGDRTELDTPPAFLLPSAGAESIINSADWIMYPIIQIIDKQARRVFNNFQALPVESYDHFIASNKSEPQARNVLVNDKEYRMHTTPLADGGAIQVARYLGETNRTLRNLLWNSIIIAASVAVIAGTGAWLITRRILKPVQQLTNASERVALTQDLNTPIKVNRPDEVGRLGRSFNSMLEALRNSRQQQRQFVADAGHELRTPLTSIRANIDLMKRTDALTEEEKRQILDDVSEELSQLSKLVTELLDLAGGDGDGAGEPISAISLAALAEEAAERARRRTSRDVTVEVSSEEELAGRADLLGRAIDNLIQNALKFSPESTTVRLRVDGKRLEVEDSGPGIPPEELEVVFDRFYRSVNAKSLPGSGLGLAIVKQIVERHNGRAWAQNTPGGAVVGFELGNEQQSRS